MKKSFLAASITLAVVVPASAWSMARTDAPHPQCSKTFTVPMVRRAIVAAYWGQRDVLASDRAHLRRFIRCMRNPRMHGAMHMFWGKQLAAWQTRRNPPLNGPAIASWYDDGGTTGCGFHATYGIATFVVPCGGTVTLVHNGNVVTATRDDSGPYVDGRTFDLNPTTKAALGCDDLCDVMWR